MRKCSDGKNRGEGSQIGIKRTRTITCPTCRRRTRTNVFGTIMYHADRYITCAAVGRRKIS